MFLDVENLGRILPAFGTKKHPISVCQYFVDFELAESFGKMHIGVFAAGLDRITS